MIAGVLPICHTPFDDNDRIDFDSLRRQVDWACGQGANGVCVGMVSEVLRLTSDERASLNQRLVEFTQGRAVVIASVGAESTRQALLFAEQAVDVGCDAVMAIPPISLAVPNEEVVAYFRALAQRVDVPVIIQDASAYVGRSIDLDVHVRLLDEFGPEKILFKPEAEPIGPNVSALRDRTDRKARIFDGSGGILLVDCHRRGIAGTMPGMEVLDGIVGLWRALEAEDEEAIYRIYFPICALVALQMQAGLDGFLAVEKYLMVKRGIFTTANRRRPSAWQLDAETTREIDRLFERLQECL